MEGGATGGSDVRTDVSTDRKGSPGTPVAKKNGLKNLKNKKIKIFKKTGVFLKGRVLSSTHAKRCVKTNPRAS